MEVKQHSMDPEQWLAAHGDALFRYALMRTGKSELAEDLVQETLLAAWRGRSDFQGLSGERTWLVAILKHKIDDHFRLISRRPVDAVVAETPDDEDAFFDDQGSWVIKPEHWRDEPSMQTEAVAFWRVVQQCLAQLPESQRESFILREIEGEETASLCKTLGVSATNLYVLLHRARLQMRQCLELNWFGGGSP